MICLRPLAISESRTSKFVCNVAPVTGKRRLQIGSRLCGFRIVDPFHCFLKLISKILKPGQASNSSFSSSSGELSLSTCSGSSTRTLELVVAVEMDRQAVTRCSKRTRLHPFGQGGVTSTHSSTTCGSKAKLIFFRLFASTAALQISFMSRITVWAQDDAKINCSELATGQPLLSTYPMFERAVDFSGPRRRASACRVFDSLSFDTNHSSQLRNLCNLRIERTNLALTCLRFGFQVTTVNIQVITLLPHC